MPELPEVASFGRYFEKTALNRQIAFVRVNNSKILRGVSPAELERQLSGSRFKSARQHGKYLFAGLDTGKWLVMHFGMTGFLEYLEDGDRESAYTRLLIGFTENGALAYVNQRMLGWVGIARNTEEIIDAKKLGPSALDSRLDVEVFRQRLSGKKSPVKSALMDQAVVAGVGNIYSDEILYQAKIHPAIKVNVLSESQVKNIFTNMKDVLRTAVNHDADLEQISRKLSPAEQT